MMTYFNRDELRKLASICDIRRYQMENVRDDENEAYLNRCVANLEADYMRHLSEKLLSAADSSARRIGIA